MGRIHPDADAAYFSRKPEVRPIAQSFLSAFDVTRGFTKTRGQDRLECLYLRAEPFIAELIGLERELLVAYAPFPQLQARTIKLHDDVVSEDRIRIDPVGTVLVCDDPKTTAAAQQYLVTDPERPPIVAISRAELLAIHDATALRGLFVEHLFRRDLFALESPLRTDTTFFGRTDIVAELFDRFRGGQTSGLFGLRRIGKTSVLYALGRRAESGEVAGSVYVDLSSPGIYQLRWWELLQRVMSDLASPLGLQRGDRSKVRALTIPYDDRSAAGHFKSDVQTTADKLPGKRVLLLLDEIEHITFDLSPSPHWSEDFLPFWQTLRSVHQDTRGQFGYVLAGVNPHIVEADRVGRFDNPLFSTTRAFFLRPFDFPTTRDMVRRISRFMGLRVDEVVFNLLFEEYGGHPFLVRQACSQLARHVPTRPGQLTAALFQNERAAIGLTLQRNVRQILNVLAIWYPDEYEMVQLLAQGDAVSFIEFAVGSAEFTQHVEGYGLVRDARTDPRISLGLVRSHLARQPRRAEESDPTDQESLVVEVSRRRNRIERAMRRFLREGLLFAHGKKAMAEAMAALPEERRAILAQFGYDQMWTELYFNELTSMLDLHFSVFQKRWGADKASVIQWMNHVNRCRSDAHAKRLGADDVAYLRVCFKRLEELLELQ